MRKNKTWVFILSFVPGVGHYYLGLMQRGLQLNLLFFGSILAIGFTRLEGLSLILPVIWFYGLFDALHLADAFAEGGTVPDRPFLAWEKIPMRIAFLGWILIFLGVCSFLAANYPFLPWERILPRGLDPNKAFVSLVLIGVGIYLLLSGRGRRGEAKESPGEGGKG